MPNDPQPGTPRFNLAQLLTVISLLLILMTLVIPALQQSRRRARETAAIAALRLVNEMQGQYAANYPQRGFACILPALSGKPGSAPPTADAAQLIPSDIASGHKAGYILTLANCGPTHYTLTAIPDTPTDRAFCTDQSTTIRFDPTGHGHCTEPLQ